MSDPTPLIQAVTCDLAGKVRGKGFPADQLEKRLTRGVGWVPTNIQITCFDGIGDSPFGSIGDLLLRPDPEAEVKLSLPNGQSEHWMLGNIVTLEGEPWPLCMRQMLRDALARLERLTGCHLNAAFEHEFQLKGPSQDNAGFGRAAFEAKRPFLEALTGALKGAGIAPDSIMKEYGPNQYEVVITPDIGIRAADAAVILREVTRSVASACGEEATFVPIQDIASVGNGVHIHFSFVDGDGAFKTYDPQGPAGMSQITDAFAAGVLKYLPAIVALTAPSHISYQRLTPHRWSAAYNNLGHQDREASLRICPVTGDAPDKIAKQFNLEYRAADAAACPHLALAAIVHAGAQGIEDGFTSPAPTTDDLSELSADALASRGFERLPETLEAALERFGNDPTVAGWFPDGFVPLYRAHKAAEIDHVKDMTVEEACAAYAETY